MAPIHFSNPVIHTRPNKHKHYLATLSFPNITNKLYLHFTLYTGITNGIHHPYPPVQPLCVPGTTQVSVRPGPPCTLISILSFGMFKLHKLSKFQYYLFPKQYNKIAHGVTFFGFCVLGPLHGCVRHNRLTAREQRHRHYHYHSKPHQPPC